MDWLLLLGAGLLEVLWMVALKFSAGFTRLWPSLAVVALGAGSLYLMSIAVRSIPMGTAYAVWTGLGAAGIAIVGMALFNEPRQLARIASIGLIIAGIAGLKLTTPSP